MSKRILLLLLLLSFVDKHRGIATRDRIHHSKQSTTREQEKSIFIGCTCAKGDLKRKYLPPFSLAYAYVAQCQALSKCYMFTFHCTKKSDTHTLAPLQTPSNCKHLLPSARGSHCIFHIRVGKVNGVCALFCKFFLVLSQKRGKNETITTASVSVTEAKHPLMRYVHVFNE